MKVKVTIPLFFTLLSTAAIAQHQPVFPALSGQELLDSLVAAYYPVFTMGQAQSRDTLFGKIYNHNDSLTCVYTGFTIWLDPALDPTQAAFMNGNSNAVNTEHTYPQSLGASGLAAGDMHHLYPTRADVNADRGNSPFGEIPDNETEEWYYLNQQTGTVPAINIDSYSERKGSLFEPREDHKGNVARAMFYFYTMYKEQADQENSAFFETQRQTLCAWHLQDPADELEWQRTWQIAQYQATPNPFVLDCTLPERSYCSDTGSTCVVSTQETQGQEGFYVKNSSPNPFRQEVRFDLFLHQASNVSLEIFNLTGEKIEMADFGRMAAGEQQVYWKKSAVSLPGIAFYRFVFKPAEGNTVSRTGKLLILPE